MNIIKTVFYVIKMFYNIFWVSAALISFVFNVFWLCCTIAAAVIPWFTLLILITCIISKFCKLKTPNEKQLINLLGGDCKEFEGSYWTIVNRGGSYDAPENSIAAIKKCYNQNLRNVFLDAALTSCGEIVLLHQNTLGKAGLTNTKINKMKYDELKDINLSELHPLGSQFEGQKIITLQELFDLLRTCNMTIFLFISDTSSSMIEKLKCAIKNYENFSGQIIITSKSPILIYQLRKLYPDLICGLWIDKSPEKFILKSSTLITSIYGAIFRNIIAPVIGISVVFVNKEECSLHISELWRNVGVRPIVYKVNSPNEKRYYQKIMKTQYLTDSIRSEPQFLIRP